MQSRFTVEDTNPVDVADNNKLNKYLLIFSATILVIIFLEVGFILLYNLRRESVRKNSQNLPSANTQQGESTATTGIKTQINDNSRTFNLLILGIDRRSPYDDAFRSDVNMLVSFTPSKKKVLITSIPRDTWIDGSRINAFISTEGIESIEQKIYQVTGLQVDRYVRLDFDALAEGVDALGGIDINIPTGFTDVSYPDDRNGNPGVVTVTFQSGQQHLDGEQALIYSRSRKGDNGEGSDFRRMARQQIVIQALPAAFFSPRCIFNPFVLERFFTAVTSQMKTDFSIEDVQLAYELLKSYKDLKIEQFVLDPEVLYTPDPNEYGGAYVLRPNDETFSEIKNIVAEKIKE